MDRLQTDPRTFKELVEADLRRAARLVIAVQDEIDPQFRIATPEGDYWLAVTLPTEEYERKSMLRRVSTFMAWKRASAFILSCQLTEPDCVYSVGIGLAERHACLSRIRGEPRPWTAWNFGAVEWLATASINSMIADLLPITPRAMTPKEISALQKWFGADGKFPAVHIESREVRGL
jgi:hypothetical protein